MKRLKFALLGLLLMLAGHASAALFTVDDFEIAANEKKTISINLTNTEEIYGYVLWLKLPEGVSIDSDDYGLSIYPTRRFNNDPISKFSEGYYKITAATGGRPVSGNSGAILEIDITASDMIATGVHTMEIVHQQITINNEKGDPKTIDQESSQYKCTTRIDAKIAASGYGSFSWPRALDFSESGAQVFVATDYKDGTMTLQSVDDGKVPANTGFVIKGDASTTVHPQTIDEEPTLALANILASTAKETIDGDGASIYALATKSKGTGFYRVGSGVTIPKYKAYLVADGSSQGAADVFLFDETTGISSLAADGAEGITYTLSGIQVKAPAQKGIYIKNGKKVILK